MKLKEYPIKAGVSNRHVHLSQEHLEILFGEGYELTPIKDLGQPGQYAAQEKVILVGPKGAIEGVRVLGPVRKATQVEISRTDAFKLGVKPPIKDSGDHEGSVGLTLVGPRGTVVLKRGVILAKRHIHMTPEDAEKLGVKDKDLVMVYCKGNGERKTIFDDVLVRVSGSYALEFHVDVDEANAAMINNNDEVYIIEEL
ncbi:MAG: phosphate propanoyltransferase [Thermotogae bacterium]|uniref:Phosphate propanoyltransferase n=1 Tax=Kosmotoga arenicorallina TaxID=688066 RepID=A0A7C5HPQ0_9BACT|nr:phosphate propanoyltransferase [Kosmotoga sp.]MBO8166094.1 phosphate propanoyltransferase [Kosmotoga sp.]MCD6159220.1 phosphate propanoyltransferase [Kosmotoga sp.]RKX49735.1 MAG: phosphate propanoyltransferase [Thermotogota bacterium]HHF08906.1 phosphate propanoyltransferase [Kosmotoga arenicorallina]